MRVSRRSTAVEFAQLADTGDLMNRPSSCALAFDLDAGSIMTIRAKGVEMADDASWVGRGADQGTAS